MGLEKIDLEELLFNLVAAVGALLTIYGFLPQAELKPATISIGLIAIGIYIRWYISKFITRKIIMQNKKVDNVINMLSIEMQKMKEELSYMKGWMSAINYFRGKKGGAIDPVTLIIAVVIVVLLVLYFQGKLS